MGAPAPPCARPARRLAFSPPVHAVGAMHPPASTSTPPPAARRSRGRRAACIGVAALLGWGLMLSTPTRLAQAAVPNDAVVLNLSGSLTAMSSAPAFSPAFSASNTDYAIYCKSGENIITQTCARDPPPDAPVRL